MMGCAVAQQTTFPGKLLDKPPVIDGVVSDEEWGSVPTASGGFDEETGAPEPYKSQYWLAYDAHFIYVAGRFEDPDPKLIHATEYRHNVSLSGDDHMFFAIDPFSTLSDTSQFEVNPQGATNVFIAGGRAAKREWLGEFMAKGRITATGWEIEARIPWSIMRLPAPGTRDVRVSFGRVLYRTARSFTVDNVAGGKTANIGIWKQVNVPRSDARRELKILPYLYAGGDRDGGIANAGLDLKAPITSELDLVGSVNPDFRNIENQVLSIDFSYFERLAGESRPFFLEGSDYFRTSLDAPLFASQRIPNFDTGAKIYGKLNENSTMAILDTVDFTHRNDLVGAFHYNFTQHTNANFAFSDQEMPGLSNKATFLSFNHDFGPYSFFAQNMTTADTTEGYGHRDNAGLTYAANGVFNDFEYVEISPKFLPRLGFAPERDLKGFLDIMQYSHPVKLGQINELEGGFGFNLLRTFENTNYRRSVDGSAGFACKDGTSVSLSGNYVEFEGFKDRYASLDLVRPRNDPYRNVSVSLVAGNIAGHSYRSISPAVSYRPWKNLQLEASYQRVDHFDLQEQSIFSANYDMSASDSVSCRAIRRGSDTDFYLAFRRTGNRGNEYFLIIGDPNSPTFRASIILKAVFPIGFRF